MRDLRSHTTLNERGHKTERSRVGSVTRRLISAALAFDPVGFVAGYLLAPEFGVEPIIGGVYGLIAASLPLSLLVLWEAQQS